MRGGECKLWDCYTGGRYVQKRITAPGVRVRHREGGSGAAWASELQPFSLGCLLPGPLSQQASGQGQALAITTQIYCKPQMCQAWGPGNGGVGERTPFPSLLSKRPSAAAVGTGEKLVLPQSDTGHSWKVQEITLPASGLSGPVQGTHGSRGSSAFLPRQASARGD